jgi:hypothetical protein
LHTIVKEFNREVDVVESRLRTMILKRIVFDLNECVGRDGTGELLVLYGEGYLRIDPDYIDELVVR